MSLISAMVFKIWSWMNIHKVDISAHHVKYTDAEAVSAVDTIDKYVENTGDRITGNFEMWANLLTDRWVESETNLFLGAGAAGAGNLNHVAGNSAYMNVALGHSALRSITEGYSNLAVGDSSLYGVTTGQDNVGVGYGTMYALTTGSNNVAISKVAGRQLISGSGNTFIGASSGYNVLGSTGLYLGYKSGYYETGSNKLYIDNAERANIADGRVKALIYGVFASSIASQLVRLNAVLEISSVKSGSTQANAGAGANEVWKTNGHATLPDNVLMIGV